MAGAPRAPVTTPVGRSTELSASEATTSAATTITAPVSADARMLTRPRPRAVAMGVDSRATNDRGPAIAVATAARTVPRSEEHTSELQSRFELVCRLLLEKKK